MVKILAFDTTNEFMSVAISKNSEILAHKFIKEVGKQAQLIVPTIEELLNKVGIWYQDLNAVSLTTGPGSFTGVRVGMSVAKGIRVATNLKVICMTCFEILTFPYCFNNEKKLGGSLKVAVVMDARQGNLFIQMFNACGSVITKPKIIKKDDIAELLQNVLENSSDTNNEVLLVGSGKNIAKKLLMNSLKLGIKTNLSIDVSTNEDLLDAKNIALLGYKKYEKSEFCSNIRPLYLRSPRVCKRKNK
ncbi:tRNA (adenosine(37)-N6)-threonylcarbamoyltransferase complex dimerization subunit type 1 TsaB [Pseudomonadota bacterium]